MARVPSSRERRVDTTYLTTCANFVMLAGVLLLLCIASALAQHDTSHMVCKDLMDDCAERVGPNKEGCRKENDPTFLNHYDCPLSCDACHFLTFMKNNPNFNHEKVRAQLRAQKDEL